MDLYDTIYLLLHFWAVGWWILFVIIFVFILLSCAVVVKKFHAFCVVLVSFVVVPVVQGVSMCAAWARECQNAPNIVSLVQWTLSGVA